MNKLCNFYSKFTDWCLSDERGFFTLFTYPFWFISFVPISMLNLIFRIIRGFYES